jgi:type IV pilus assembly protein PilQ
MRIQKAEGRSQKANPKLKILAFGLWFLVLGSWVLSYAQDTKVAAGSEAKKEGEVLSKAEIQMEAAQPSKEAKKESQPLPEETLTTSQNVTLDFKDADILKVLKIISYKSGVNIVNTPEVMGNVNIRMVDVPWEMALDVLLKTYGFGYQRQGNVILVTKLENITKIQEQEPLQTEIFILKFLDAQDAQKIIVPLLSPRGKTSVLFARGQKGWQFGTFKIGPAGTTSEQLKREEEKMATETLSMERTPSGDIMTRKAEFEPSAKSKVLVVTDTAASLDRIRNVILPQIDKRPQQVLIEARIMEVNRDKLKDLGIDWGTGSGGASGYTSPPTDLFLNKKNSLTVAGRNLSSEFAPSVFGPKEGTSFTGKYPYSAGLEILFKKVSGTQFEVILHALEEDVHTNTLSAPRILTLDNQEASILVGYHTPILRSEVTAGTTTEGSKLTQTLDYYQEIGIRLMWCPRSTRTVL